METLYTARLHGFPNLTRSGMEPALSEESVLSLLIVLGSSISLVGLVFAFITYSLFSDLRNLAGTTLMNLLAALFMTQLLYVIGVGGVPDPELCVSLAFSLHYIRLCVFCWMLVMAHHMYTQFTTNLNLVPITDNSIGRHFIKYSVLAWGVPGLLLAAAVLIQYHDKAGKMLDTASLKVHNCWFLDKNGFIYGLLVPVALIVLITLSYLLRAAVVSRYVISMQVDKRVRDKMRRKRTLQIVLFTKGYAHRRRVSYHKNSSHELFIQFPDLQTCRHTNVISVFV
ncbi:adhesion G protein-coupled receptor E2-like isoform X2 [Atheta coriaria]|uniref:adhesion G protein-coupled receptor E2-like isoform X2 n=1 Tax=Dalotia coriaria TaxID=877792 RepID=UPI0031F431D4